MTSWALKNVWGCWSSVNPVNVTRDKRRRLRRARLKVPDASPEDIDYRTARGLDRALTARLLSGEWLRQRQNLILVGPTGLGNSWLGCAFAIQACRQGFSACYLRVPKLNEELAIAHGSGATRGGSHNLQRRIS